MKTLTAGLAALALLAGTATAGAAGRPTQPRQPGPSWSRTRSATAFGEAVLGAAPLPRGARVWKGIVPTILRRPAASSGSPLDLRRFFLVNPPATTLESYVIARLPKGTKSTGSGWTSDRHGQTSENFSVSLPTTGPNEYSASLSYVTSTSTGRGCVAGKPCLLRVDSQTVWEPDRPSIEDVPAGYRVTLTGYRSVSLTNSSSGSVALNLSPANSAKLVKAFNTLPLGPSPMCMEDVTVYTISFRAAKGRQPAYKVVGAQCGAVVYVWRGNAALHTLYDKGCPLSNLIRRLLPASAAGTREAVLPC